MIIAAVARMILEQTARGVERVTDGDMRILMCMVRAWVSSHHDLATGDCEIDADVEQPALMMPLVAAFDDDVAGGDTIEELVEFFRTLTDPCL